jgi:DNA-binding transcriptional LysR family regulator
VRSGLERAQLEAALEIHGLHLRDLAVALELPSNEAVRAAVESGSAATVISASVAAPGIEAGLRCIYVAFLSERICQAGQRARMCPCSSDNQRRR